MTSTTIVQMPPSATIRPEDKAFLDLIANLAIKWILQ